MVKYKNKQISKFILYIISIFLCCFSILPVTTTFCAETEAYTSCEQDLMHNAYFDISKYPVDSSDYRPQVVQVAEFGKELFLYVYCPTDWLNATSVNLYFTEEISTIKNYKLQFINNYKTIRKYLVKDFLVLSDSVRYYSIPSIFRAFHNLVDKKPVGDNTISEVSFEVGQSWRVTTNGEQNQYVMKSFETIEVISKYVGFVRYDEGWGYWDSACDSHYVAFTTDRDMDRLLEADVEYIARDYYKYTGSDIIYTSYSIESKTLSHTNKVVEEVGWFGHKYSWNEIESVSDFVSNENLKDEVKSALADKKWVLRFETTAYEWKTYVSGLSIKGKENATDISDVTILRLKFETNGVVYDLAVVDNKQSGDLIPDNEKDWPLWLKILFAVLVLILLCVLLPILAPILAIVFKAIYYVLKYIFIVLFWCLSLPFKMFKKGGD